MSQQEKSNAGGDSDDDLLKELGFDSDGNDDGSSKSKKKSKDAAQSGDVEASNKSAKAKKVKRSHSKAMDGFIVSDDESSDEDAPKKRKKSTPTDAAKPDFEMPDVEVRRSLFPPLSPPFLFLFPVSYLTVSVL